jgi:hypothetical protein
MTRPQKTSCHSCDQISGRAEEKAVIRAFDAAARTHFREVVCSRSQRRSGLFGEGSPCEMRCSP